MQQIDLGVVIGVIGTILAIFGYVLNRDRDKKNDATASAEVKVTLNHISHNVHDMKNDFRDFKEQMHSVNKEIIRLDAGLKSVEKSAATAHERITQMKKNGGES